MNTLKLIPFKRQLIPYHLKAELYWIPVHVNSLLRVKNKLQTPTQGAVSRTIATIRNSLYG